MNDHTYNQVDKMLTKQIPRLTLAVVAVVVARNISQAVAMVITETGYRIANNKIPYFTR